MDRSRSRKRPDESVLMLVILAVVLAAGAVADACWHLGDWLAGVRQAIPVNPLAALLLGLTHRLVWPVQATMLTVLGEVALAGIVTVVATASTRRRNSAEAQVKAASKLMAGPHELGDAAGKKARQKAARLHPGGQIREPSDIGILLGRTVQGNKPIYMSWEDVGVCFAGARTGKTSALAVPALCDAPAAAIATSNKRDLRDCTRGVREKVGRIWESDLQGITGDRHQEWWWNPLSAVTNLNEARALADPFASAAKEDNARADAYFSGGSQELLALYMWASAAGAGDLIHTLAWLSDPDDTTAHNQLIAAGDAFAATKLATAQGLNIRQRDGLYDMARRNLDVLLDPVAAAATVPPQRARFEGDTSELASWTTGVRHDLPEFDPAAFVRSSDTLYALSMEGPASATGYTTALVGRIFNEALKLARASVGGRLPNELVAILDEAANVCKLRELPKLYSHLGSQGVVVLTFLQSPAQAADLWSPEQLLQLAGQSNVHYYGGGIRDKNYLADLSAFADEYEVERWSRSRGHGGSSASQSWSREPILSLAALANLPKEYAVVWISGNPPVIVRKNFWSNGPRAAEVQASLEKYGPRQREEAADAA